MRRRGALVVLVLAVACSRAPEPTAAPASEAPKAAPLVSSASSAAPLTAMPSSIHPVEVTTDPKLAVKQLAQATKELDDLLAAGAPDCGAAKTLRDRICALVARICELAEQHRDPELTQRCEEAKPSCERAVNRVAGPCGS